VKLRSVPNVVNRWGRENFEDMVGHRNMLMSLEYRGPVLELGMEVEPKTNGAVTCKPSLFLF
jgi:hypothetical protein